VKRLHTLTDVVERAGRGYFTQLDDMPRRWLGDDEVGVLIRKFNVMEQQLEEREKELLQSKKLAAIGTLASGIAHELNNPLNNIYTTAQRLMKKAEQECPVPLKKGLDDIFGQAMRVKQIVSDLLEFARGREPQLREVELVGLLRGVYRKLGNTLDTAKINFILESQSEEIKAYADPVQMEQVFINLFMNAVEAMSSGGTLKVKVRSAEGNVTVEVADSGAGMPPETVDKIFEPFFTTKDKGTGLGLAIIFNIIQKHNGGIRVESTPGSGTLFIVTFPVRKG
jgi:two-component system NtrC family sensor kinase